MSFGPNEHNIFTLLYVEELSKSNEMFHFAPYKNSHKTILIYKILFHDGMTSPLNTLTDCLFMIPAVS